MIYSVIEPSKNVTKRREERHYGYVLCTLVWIL